LVCGLAARAWSETAARAVDARAAEPSMEDEDGLNAAGVAYAALTLAAGVLAVWSLWRTGMVGGGRSGSVWLFSAWLIWSAAHFWSRRVLWMSVIWMAVATLLLIVAVLS
jgi:hypothetical protein